MSRVDGLLSSSLGTLSSSHPITWIRSAIGRSIHPGISRWFLPDPLFKFGTAYNSPLSSRVWSSDWNFYERMLGPKSRCLGFPAYSQLKLLDKTNRRGRSSSNISKIPRILPPTMALRSSTAGLRRTLSLAMIRSLCDVTKVG